MVSRLTLVCALASLVASVALSGTKVPWQKRLDRALLDVDTKPRQRLKNLQSVPTLPASGISRRTRSRSVSTCVTRKD